MRKISALTLALALTVTAAVAQTQSQSAASKADLLSLEQKVKLSKLITRRTEPAVNPGFSIAIGGVVPTEISLHSIPSDAEQVAPQIRGLGYVVVEELIALVDPRTREIVIAFQRSSD